jgi:hypothetical protein
MIEKKSNKINVIAYPLINLQWMEHSMKFPTSFFSRKFQIFSISNPLDAK